MPYCGCGTRLNKKLWCLAVTATLLLVACFVAYVVTATECLNHLEDEGCIQSRRQGYVVTDTTDQCVRDHYNGVCYAVRITFWLGILFVILAIIPCCVMCCCSPKPAPKYSGAPVAHTAGGHHGHHGHHGSYDSYGGSAHPQGGTYDTYGNGTGGTYDYYGGQPAHGNTGTNVSDQYGQYGGAPAGGYTKPTHHSPAV